LRPGLSFNGLYPAYIRGLAYLQLGEGREEFLTIWKDADPDIPILKQAKAEFAKLH